jgi:integrase/recombinase XerD
MNKSHAGNTRIKRDYFAYLKGPKRQSEPSIDAAAKALNRFEVYTRHKDFKTFRKEQAIAFTAHLSGQVNERTKQPLSKATLFSTLAALKAFFTWLAQQRGFKSRFSYLDADYFSLSLKDTAIAKAVRGRPVPSIDQIRHVISVMPHASDIERRDRALIAFALMTGARDDALASMRLKHIDLIAGKVNQDAREVRTKFSKTFPTYFLPIGGDIRAIFEEWVKHLQRDLLWGPDDPLFPKTRIVFGPNRHFESGGLDCTCWRNAGPIRTIFRKAFEAAGLPYFNPHSFRHTLARHGQEVCETLEDHKALSQNLGHSSIKTTQMNYGEIPTERQAELIRNLGKAKHHDKNVLSLACDLIEAIGSSRG